jgi:hypothetical protein
VRPFSRGRSQVSLEKVVILLSMPAAWSDASVTVGRSAVFITR